MKFLVITRQREVPPGPPEEQKKLVRDTIQVIQKFEKECKVEAAYGFAGLSGGSAIFNAESGGELNDLLMSLPNFPFMDTEIYPLMPLEKAIEAQK